MIRIRDYLKPLAFRIFLTTMVKLIGTLAELFLPWALAYVLDKVVPTKSVELIMVWGAIMVVCAVFALVFNILANRMAAKVSAVSVQNIRHDLFAKIMSLSCGQIDKVSIPSAVSRLTADTYNVHAAIGMVQKMGVRAPILLLGGLSMTMFLDPTLSLVLIALIPVMALVVLFIARKGVPLYGSVQRSLDKLVETIREGVTGIRIIKALSKSEYEMNKFNAINKEVAKKETRATVIMGLNNPIMNLFLNIGLVAVIIVGAYEVNYGLGVSSSIIAFMNYFIIISTAIMAISRIFVLSSKALASSKRICEILNLPKDLVVEEIEPIETDYHIIFDNVTFSYLKRSRNIQDISFKLKKGESLGIIGATGSGKSTVINTLMRLYDIDNGNIYIGGRNVKSIEEKELHRIFGIAFQNDILFSDSISENIAFGRNLSHEEIEYASNYAQAGEFINSLEKRLKHKLTIKGSNLSGGQKQRVIISRALASNPEILILDDSSSALDYKTDSHLRQDITEHYPDTTTIIVAQRISSIKNCNYILVLEEGEMIGYGTHDELMESCYEYQVIAKNQMGLSKEGV